MYIASKDQLLNQYFTINEGLYLVMFNSRNKDNKHLDGFEQRTHTFFANKSDNILNKFNDFVNNGVDGELSRLYVSINTRDENIIQNKLIHRLIDEPISFFNFHKLLSSIAMKPECKASKRWLFDFDSDNEDDFMQVLSDINTFCKDLTLLKTINGYHIIVPKGFDTRELMKKWGHVLSLHRDDFALLHYKTKNEREVYNG